MWQQIPWLGPTGFGWGEGLDAGWGTLVSTFPLRHGKGGVTVIDHGLVSLLRRQHGVVTRAQARAMGLSARQIDYRVRVGHWVAEGRGVYRDATAAPSWHSRLLVTCLRYGALASHRSAAVLHGIEGYRPGPLEIVVAPGSHRSVPGLRCHQSTQMDRAAPVTRDAIPCTGLARTVLDLAAVVGRPRLEDTIDAVVRDHGLELADLYDVLVRHSRRGRDGCGRLREALDARLGRETVPRSRWSRMVRNLLVDRGLPEPVFEYPVESGDGRRFEIDLAYPRARLAIELDSVRWHHDRRSFERDRMRRNRLTAAGWIVLNYTWDRFVEDPAGLCSEVRRCLGAQWAPLTSGTRGGVHGIHRPSPEIRGLQRRFS